MKLTPVYEETPDGFAAYIEEMPDVRALGATPEEAMERLASAVEQVYEVMRELTGEPPRA